MKKKLLAAGVAVALGALSGAASAALQVNATGIGAINVVPYYSVQDGNETLLSIVNTDTVNGKAVKVRFRGADWSDDVFDFQVFLSPGDVWTASVTQKGNAAFIVSRDSTCTLPASLKDQGFPFMASRLQSSLANTGTLEGYIEVMTMGNIVPPAGANDLWVTGASTGTTGTSGANVLYSAIKHPTNGQPACRTIPAAQALLENLQEDSERNRSGDAGALGLTAASAEQQSWMAAPTSSLTTYATIINVPTSKAFTNLAVAIAADNGVKQYFRQTNAARAFDPNVTADRLFASVTLSGLNAWNAAPAPATSDAALSRLSLGAAVTMRQFDLPDLSTPQDTSFTTGLAAGYTDGATAGISAASQAALAQRDAIAGLLAKAQVITEFVTAASLGAATDVVISQPVRRYFYEYRQVPVGGNAAGSLVFGGNNFYVNGAQTSPVYNAVALVGTEGLNGLHYGSLDARTNRITVQQPTFYDREENTVVSSSEILPSPQPDDVAATYSLQGEVSVISINNDGDTTTGALRAKNTINDYTVTAGAYDVGWVSLSTTTPAADGSRRLPVIGFTAMNLQNKSVNGGTNYGMVIPQRYLMVNP